MDRTELTFEVTVGWPHDAGPSPQADDVKAAVEGGLPDIVDMPDDATVEVVGING
jgi:hypothetical protein